MFKIVTNAGVMRWIKKRGDKSGHEKLGKKMKWINIVIAEKKNTLKSKIYWYKFE